MTKPKIIYRWWFIAICFLSFFLIPVGLLLWILKTRELTAQKKALEEQCGQYETANNNLDETVTGLREKVRDYETTIQSRIDEAEKVAQERLIEAEKLAHSRMADIEERARNNFERSEKELAESKQKISDAEKQAQKIIQDANDEVQHARELERDIRRIRAEAEKHEQTAREAIETANLQALAIVDDAQRKVTNLEKTAQALKNVIEGYGDEYLIPANTLLDELAEHFGFAEASEKFKEAKANTKRLMKISKAGACDYVEQNRSQTASNFVVDAFNGKVDSILSKLKGGENFGKCKQAILDACALVNQGGAAFRNARITDEFLESRLNELKWATVLLELKKKEQEEQRTIRERMREEARAQAEFEKAKQQAEKEEARLRAAQEKMEQALLHATESQRQKYEKQLQELQEKLRTAEEQSKRAQSMAELTKAGHVYVISNIGSFGERVFKIGMTRRLDPEDRIDELSNASVPFPFDIHAMIYSENAPDLERKLHEVFDPKRVNKVNLRKEFFRVSLDDIESEVQKLGLQVHFTTLAKAEEYRETRNIEQATATAG